MGGEESPFMKDYRDQPLMALYDMAGVCDEVVDFLIARYGRSYKIGNMLVFLQVLTVGFLLRNDIALDEYVEVLRAVYKFFSQA